MKKLSIKSFLVFTLILALSVTSFAACGQSESSGEVSSSTDSTSGESSAEETESTSTELSTIRVALMTGSSDQYAVYIGTEEGIFEKYGVKVETTEYAAGINTVDAIQNGTADTGLLADFAAANRLGKTLHQTNLVLFSELGVSAPKNGGLYVAPEFADDPSKLDGSKGWITTIGTVSEYYNWQSQTYIGVDPDKQNMVQTDSKQTSLALVQNGDASAIVAYGADGSYYEEQGWKLAAKSEDIGIRIGSYLVTTKDYIDNNEEVLANYIKALKESIDYITDNLDPSAEKIEAKFGVKQDDFKKTWEAFEFTVGFTEEGAVQLDNLNAWAYGQGKYDEEYNIRDFIDTRAVEIAVPDNVTVKK